MCVCVQHAKIDSPFPRVSHKDLQWRADGASCISSAFMLVCLTVCVCISLGRTHTRVCVCVFMALHLYYLKIQQAVYAQQRGCLCAVCWCWRGVGVCVLHRCPSSCLFIGCWNFTAVFVNSPLFDLWITQTADSGEKRRTHSQTHYHCLAWTHSTGTSILTYTLCGRGTTLGCILIWTLEHHVGKPVSVVQHTYRPLHTHWCITN